MRQARHCPYRLPLALLAASLLTGALYLAVLSAYAPSHNLAFGAGAVLCLCYGILALAIQR